MKYFTFVESRIANPRQLVFILIFIGTGLLPFYEYITSAYMTCEPECQTSLNIGFQDFKFYFFLLLFTVLFFFKKIKPKWLRRICLIIVWVGILTYSFIWGVILPSVRSLTCCELHPKIGFIIVIVLFFLEQVGVNNLNKLLITLSMRK